MNRKIGGLFFLLMLASAVCAMPAGPRDAKRWFVDLFENPATVPVTFTYGDRTYCGLGGLPVEMRNLDHLHEGSVGILVCRLDENLTVELRGSWNCEFNEVEYTVWFANTGTKPTAPLKDVYAYRNFVPGEQPRLRGILGDHDNFYAAYDSDLTREPRAFTSTNGRATHIVFPYFDFVHGDGGTLMALGWAGTWSAGFLGTGSTTVVMAQTGLGFNAALLPGERVRTGLVVLLPYEGRDADHATNLWRAWFQKYNMPKANLKGEAIQPFSTMCFAGDTGLPNSDGSISERSTTWKRTLDKLKAENIVPDFRWFDAGWYCDPAGRSVPTDWWGTVGTWEIDREKWPGSSFRESNEACHAAGMKVLTWFEPERVTHLDDLVKNYGYKRAWGVQTGGCITSNIGDEECLAWTLNRITRMLDEHAVDLYREDNNSDPATAWRILDARDAAASGLPRTGVNENKCIQGHYKLWDGILAYCTSHGKCAFLDSCASGGGRNDIESMRRGVPFMRSDFDRTTIPMRLSQSWGFNKWVPFHGSSTKDTVGQLDDSKGRGSDAYIVRASYLPIYNYGEAVSHRPDLDFDLLRRNLAEWRSVSHLLTRDFYTLTPWHGTTFQEGWTVYAYDAPDLGESIVLAFRMEQAKEATFTAHLKFAEAGADYEIVDADSGAKQTRGGWDLRLNGLEIALPQPRTSALLRIRRTTRRPVHEHGLAEAMQKDFALTRATCADAAGGAWSFLSATEVVATDAMPLQPMPYDGAFQGFRAAGGGFPHVLVGAEPREMLVPGVAGGRTDRPFKALECLFHPAPKEAGRCRGIARYTAPRKGVYSLMANVRAMNIGGGRVDVSVVRDGEILWQGEVVRGGDKYVDLPQVSVPQVALEQGQSLDFVVGPGLTDARHACDGTGVQLIILEAAAQN